VTATRVAYNSLLYEVLPNLHLPAFAPTVF
jgi:hypothetical protein